MSVLYCTDTAFCQPHQPGQEAQPQSKAELIANQQNYTGRAYLLVEKFWLYKYCTNVLTAGAVAMHPEEEQGKAVTVQ